MKTAAEADPLIIWMRDTLRGLAVGAGRFVAAAAWIGYGRRVLFCSLWLALSTAVPAQEPQHSGAHQNSATAMEAAVSRTEQTYFVPDVVLRDVDGRTVALGALL